MDICMTKCGITDLIPGKGFHYPVGAYVEYIGNIPAERRDPLVNELNEMIAKTIVESQEEDRAFMKVCEYDEAKSILKQVPPYIPEGQAFRVVKLSAEDGGCPCGGTHVPHIKDIGVVKVTKIKKNGKNVRVSYTVE